jgi:ribosome-associated protein
VKSRQRPSLRPKARPTSASQHQITTQEARRIALMVAEAGLDKKASDVQIIDVSGKVDYADFLVLMSGQSDRHVAALAQSVEGELKLKGVRAVSLEGLPKAQWVLVDFVDVVVHIFLDSVRSLYDLDGLWIDAARVIVPEGASHGPGGAGGEPS